MSLYLGAVEKHRQKMLDALEHIWKHPETGYREWKTHAYLEEEFAKLGYELTLAGDIPGFTAMVDTGREGPTVAVFGELDALINPGHPDAAPETFAVHSCGHCAQCAALLGLAAALKEPGVLDEMCGRILLVAVPAEELIEVEFRADLQKKGVISYMGGKTELLHRGLLDGVDLAFMLHTGNSNKLVDTTNGCIVKKITYKGVSTHAGGSPHLGINALYAANLGLSAINALRETFKDEDHIRVHPIITSGGEAVNAIPDVVRMESYVRGMTMDAIMDVNRKVNRALAATAAAMGGNVHIEDMPGYWPRVYDTTLTPVMRDVMQDVLGKVEYKPGSYITGCSDIGDLGALMPILHPVVGGAAGKGHGNDYRIADPELACVGSAKVQLVFLAKILGDNAKLAKQAVENYKPLFENKEAYFSYLDSIVLDKDAVTYHEDGSVTLL